MNILNRALVLAAVSGLAGPAHGQLFLVDDAFTPRVEVSWPTRDGERRLTGEFPYRSVGERTTLGGNITCYVMLGGIRLNRGLGHPKGQIVRVGLAKEEADRPFFDGIVTGGVVTITLSNVRFTLPDSPRPETIVQEMGYGTDPSLCGLPGQPEAMYNTFSRTDTLRDKLTSENSRLGILDGRTEGGGRVEFSRDGQGLLRMSAEIPYALFRHVNDPWLRTNPGGFNEPNHFHIEFEVLPADVAAVEGMADLPANAGSQVAAEAVRFASDDATLQRGRFLYLNHSCWTCHGREGKGDGPGAKELIDAQGQPIAPTDFTKGEYRSGPAPEDLYRTIALGSPGTPMAGYRAALMRQGEDGAEDDSEIRALVAYVRSLARG